MEGRKILEGLSGRATELLDTCGRKAEDRGEIAYLVGGSVRDLILGRAETDLDVVVVGEGMAVAQALARDTGGSLTRHHAFQTARVDTRDGIRIDVATARSEEYPRPGHLPRVISGSLREDLERRDFSINAMAIALGAAHHGDLIDPEGGVSDLSAGIIRVLHSRSFADDPTRILRALRFAERFGYRLEEQTAHQLDEAITGGYMEYLTGARLRRELSYMLSESPVDGPLVLQAHGVLKAIHEELAPERSSLEALAENRVWYGRVVEERGSTSCPGSRAGIDPGSAAAPDQLGPPLENGAILVDPGWSLVLAGCAADLAGQERGQLATRLGLSRAEREPLIEGGARWLRALGEWRRQEDEARCDPLVVDEIFSRFGVGTLLVQLAGPETRRDDELRAALRRFLSHTKWVRPGLRGGDLIDLGIPRGPSLGLAMEFLRQARIAGSVDDEEGERQAILEWLAHREQESP